MAQARRVNLLDRPAAKPVSATMSAGEAPKPPSPYEISSGIPLPAKKKNPRSRAEDFPFAALEVGQSFFVPDTPPRAGGMWTVFGHRRNPGKKFAARREGNGTRIWRTE